MKRGTFGKIVAELRKSQFDPSSGKIWSQKAFATEISENERLVASIEQGKKAYIDQEILFKMAEAFNLTSLERQEFFNCAVEISAGKTVVGSQPSEEILRGLIKTMEQLRVPALVYDEFFDVVAYNSIILALYSLEKKTSMPDFRQNVIGALFSNNTELRQIFSTSWHQVALNHVHRFRASTLGKRHSEYFKKLFEDLCQLPDFKQIWMTSQYAETDQFQDAQIAQHYHPRFGEISYLAAKSTTLTSDGKLYLLTLSPANSNTAKVFEKLACVRATSTNYLAIWPKISE